MSDPSSDVHTSFGRDPHQVLFGLQHLANERLAVVLETVLRRTDDYLFDRGNTGTDGVELTALRDLRRARSLVSDRFQQSLLAGFRKFSGVQAADGLLASNLSLVGEDELEKQLADEQIIDSLSRLHAPALAALEARLAALLGRPALAAGENPVGPMALAQVIRDSLQGTELSPGVNIVLLKFFERELSEALHGLYERFNERLVSVGILPHLRTVAPKPAPKPVQATVPGPVQHQPVDHSPGWASDGPAETALFSSLVGLLQGWRHRISGSDSEPQQPKGPSLQATDILSVLSLMQSNPPQGLTHAMGDQRVSLAELLRREVLDGARRLGMGGEDLSLSNSEADAVDLVGMLFDVLLDERDFEPDTRQKIGRMLVPYVKVAVTDRRMFLFKGHPARRLLNAVAEACEGNHGEGPQEKELLSRVDQTIDRLVTEYNEDVAIFETLEQELRAFMAQHLKRIELSEKRAAEAQRGRERLEQAREVAATDVSSRRADRELPPAMGEFLAHYANHHFTQIILRDGRESPRYDESMRAITGLLVAFDHAELGAPVETLPPLATAELLAILESSGCVGHAADETMAAIQHTLARIAQGDGPAQIETSLPPPPVATAPIPAPEPLLAVVADAENLDFDADVAEHIRALGIGSWVQLTSDSGRSEPAKVSWISPISSRLLFVNRRGIRVLVASIEELAAMAKLGRLELRGVDTAFEDSMQQIIGRLKAETPVEAQPAMA